MQTETLTGNLDADKLIGRIKRKKSTLLCNLNDDKW